MTNKIITNYESAMKEIYIQHAVIKTGVVKVGSSMW